MITKPLIIGISGGTGSGKTRFTKELLSRCDKNNVIYISQDSYYKDLSHITYEQRCEVNFDNPDSIDFILMEKDVKKLIDNQETSIPIYDYKTHTREKKENYLCPKPVLIIEGIFSLYDIKIRNLIDIKIYVDTPADIRVLRRIKRDVNKRKRTIESVISQYIDTVKPMHDKYIEPTKAYADIIVLNGGKNKGAIDIINNKLLPKIKSKFKNVNT